MVRGMKLRPAPERRSVDDPPRIRTTRGSSTNDIDAYAATSDRDAPPAPPAAPAAPPAGINSDPNMMTRMTRMTPFSGIIQRYIHEDPIDKPIDYFNRNKDGYRNYNDGRSPSKNDRGVDPYRRDDNDDDDDYNRSDDNNDHPIFGTSRIADQEELIRVRQQRQEQQAAIPSRYDYYSSEGILIDSSDDTDTTTLMTRKERLMNGLMNPIRFFRRGKNETRRFFRRNRERLRREKERIFRFLRLTLVIGAAACYKLGYFPGTQFSSRILNEVKKDEEKPYPDFVYAHPYVTSSYYTSTHTIEILEKMYDIQVEPKKDRKPDRERGITSRLAILRPFCEFDADALPTTFACWNSLVPCRAAEMDLGDESEEEDDEWVLFDMAVNGTGRKLRKGDEDKWECDAPPDFETKQQQQPWIRGIANSLFKRCRKKPKEYFDDVPADALRTASVDLFLFYSQTFSENDVAMKSVDEIMTEFFSPGGWSRCFDNIYAIEANIPKELDLYIPAAQEELYSWVNGPNRQYEAGFRIIQSGEWGDYDGFYLMEGDSVPVKNYWLDVIMGEIKAHKPFAVLGAQYDGDKWDAFYEDIPLSLLHHTNGNGIYNTSHPLLERLTGQLEVEAPCPYNSIPYDYRMSQMWVEGTLGIVPQLATKIMLNEEGENITLSDNTPMFSKWANRWKDEVPYRFTKAIHNYAATNLIPRHLGPEYVIHGAKLYSPWDPARTKVTLVIMEWFFDRSLNLIEKLDSKDHPFSQVIIMIPPSVTNTHDYTQYTAVPVTLQFRDSADYMDLCSADVKTEWFMITNSYHQVSRHVDLMFTPGKFVPVVPFTPATYPFCLKYPYCKEIIMLSQRWNPKHKQVILDMDMLYHTKERNAFCREWRERNGDDGEDLYAVHQPLRWKLREEKIIGPKGPTGTDYLAYLGREGKASMYKMTDRSLYGARAPFVKVYKKEEKLDGMSEEELARRVGMTLLSNTTECSCDRYETEEECLSSGLGCQWRPLFESCHPPEMIDDGIPICSSTDPPTMSPTISIDTNLQETESPTVDSGASSESEVAEGSNVETDSVSVLTSMFKTREHEIDTNDEEDDASDGRRNLLVSTEPVSTEVHAITEENHSIEKQGDEPNGRRHLLASTESPTVAVETSTDKEEDLDIPLSAGLQSIIADAETRDFVLEQLQNHPSLGRRAGAKLFRKAASLEIHKQLSDATHRFADDTVD